MVRIVTDNASDITKSEAKKLGLELVYLPITFEDAEYNERAHDTFDEFYRLLKSSKNLPKTSQVPPGDYLDIFNDAKEKGDEVVVVTLSSGLSGTYSSAVNAMKLCGYAGLHVVDSEQAVLSQRILAEAAVKMRDAGKSANEIVTALVDLRNRVTVFGVVDTLTYLKKGGRIPPVLALIGNTFNIKPVIIVRNRKLEVLAKVKGTKKGIKHLYEEYEKAERDPAYPVYFGHSDSRELGEGFMRDTAALYNLTDTGLYSIGSVIGTHLGPQTLAIAYVRK
jgi:DegV family protein with EDD domain